MREQNIYWCKNHAGKIIHMQLGMLRGQTLTLTLTLSDRNKQKPQRMSLLISLLLDPTSLYYFVQEKHSLDCLFLPDCPADGHTWVPKGDKCYHFIHGKEESIKSYTFDRAKSLCQGFSMWSSFFFVTILLKKEKKKKKQHYVLFLMCVSSLF